ncbi:hypothetical protein [Marinimicrobium sp. ABcell2]|uniref:hypothetical protein n=1 Tax=Marinimicrobium sp. ABcell2 TaxID=3069751 RepID=UPI0027ADB235|nr:hypothetical protein [Marinimicrobium sp. ABcell2]MDQ2077173.1 hypothetical protein [Marinimicrobium sp. ABcell2]
MKHIKVLCLAAAACLGANLAWANGGHFAVDDAGIAPGGSCGMESWISRVDSTNTATLSPMCNFTGGSEWTLPLVYNLEGSELAYMGLEYKTVWLDTGRGPALAFDAGFMYNRLARDFEEYYINIPASFQALENLTLHLNTGARHEPDARDTYATWGLAATVKTVNGPVLIMEYSDDDRYDPLIAAGARFRVGATRWTMDLGVAHDTGPGDNIFTIGLNIPRFF